METFPKKGGSGWGDFQLYVRTVSKMLAVRTISQNFQSDQSIQSISQKKLSSPREARGPEGPHAR